MEERTHDGKPCRVSEMQIGATLFTVISVESVDAKRCREQELKSRPSASIGILLVQLISQQTKKKRHNLHCRKLCRLFQRLKIPN